MIDVHAHIKRANFSTDPTQYLELVLEQAQLAGIRHIVSVSESVEDAQEILDIAKESKGFIWPALGLHPDQGNRSVTMQDYEAFEPILKRSLEKKEICCVGEIGLDFTAHVLSADPEIAEREKEEQRQVFKLQVLLAIQYNLAVNVHSRSAGHHALDILYECGATRVNMHAFDGSVKYTHNAVENGFFFSIAPIIVRLPHQQELVKTLPMSRLLLESDAPALSPVKGQTNVPANISIAAAEIAKIKSITVEQVIEQTTRNTLLWLGHQHD